MFDEPSIYFFRYGFYFNTLEKLNIVSVKLMFANADLTFVILFFSSGVSWTAKRFDVTGKASFIFFTGKNTALKKLDQFKSKYWLFFGMFLSFLFVKNNRSFFVLKFLLFYLVNEEFQQKTKQSGKNLKNMLF